MACRAAHPAAVLPPPADCTMITPNKFASITALFAAFAIVLTPAQLSDPVACKNALAGQFLPHAYSANPVQGAAAMLLSGAAQVPRLVTGPWATVARETPRNAREAVLALGQSGFSLVPGLTAAAQTPAGDRAPVVFTPHVNCRSLKLQKFAVAAV